MAEYKDQAAWEKAGADAKLTKRQSQGHNRFDLVDAKGAVVGSWADGLGTLDLPSTPHPQTVTGARSGEFEPLPAPALGTGHTIQPVKP